MRSLLKIYISFFFLLITYCLLPTTAFSQPITFERWYNFGYTENGFSVEQTFDGGYIVAGRHGISFTVSDLLLMKTDSLGVTQWTKFIKSGPYEHEGWDVKQTADSGYVITGKVDIVGMGVNVYFVKTNKNGDTLWTKNYGGISYDKGWSIVTTYDGGYAIAAQYDTLAWLLKTNSNGDTLWSKKYIPQGTIASTFRSLQQTSDSGFILCGGTAPVGAMARIYLVKTNKNGDTLWTKIFTYMGKQGSNSVSQTSDGGYIIAGSTGDGINPYNLYIIKTNSNGDTLWTKTFTNADWALRAVETSDGGYIVLGFTDKIGYGGDFYLARMNSNGDTLWTKTFGGTDLDVGDDLKLTTDGGFIIVGTTTSFSPLGSVYLIKTDSSGNVITSALETQHNNLSFVIYPNPIDDKVTILFFKRIPDGEIVLNDMMGRTINKSAITQTQKVIFTEDLTNGIYLIQIISENKIIATKKLIIQH